MNQIVGLGLFLLTSQRCPQASRAQRTNETAKVLTIPSTGACYTKQYNFIQYDMTRYSAEQ